jgi:hypothetical protein
MKRNVLLLGALLSLYLTSCKKDSSDPSPSNPPTAADKLKDSVLLYTRDIYLWYNQIPQSFDARKYSDPDKIMAAIRPYSKEPGFTNAVDRWSFAVTKMNGMI